MLFRRPELLYLLFALVIPIIVHFFQLRKFEKIYFTNVAFLKQVMVNSRKSSKIRKWLLLITRSLALTALVLAFAQPFIPASEQAVQERSTAIYLDNSFSMQMPGAEMSLLKEAVQDLIPKVKNASNTLIFTNDVKIEPQKEDDWKNKLLELDHSPTQLSMQAVKLRAEEFFAGKNSRNQLVVISDLQRHERGSLDLSAEHEVNVIPLRSKKKNNFYIEKARLLENEGQKKLQIRIKASMATDQRVAMSIKNGEELMAKKTVEFNDNKVQKVNISLTEDDLKKGIISLDDNGLEYDDHLYFSINPLDKINILSINATDDNFLRRIYRGDAFSYRSSDATKLNLADVEDAELIILNEVKNLSNALKDQLMKAVENGKSICIIPDTENSTDDYNDILKRTGLPLFRKKFDNEKKITKINFQHPLLENVFSKKVENFEYPKVKKGFKLNSSQDNVLRFLDESPFLLGKNKVYTFSSGLSVDDSNFQASPLIVPVFYNMAVQSINDLPLYQTIGENSTYSIKADIGKDDIVRLINEEVNFIPRQSSEGESLIMETREEPKKAGNYRITQGKDTLAFVSYNHSRNESKLEFHSIDQENNFASINAFFEHQSNKNDIVELWKWLLIFALLMLIAEILILKYLK
jgi:hypothetical protein